MLRIGDEWAAHQLEVRVPDSDRDVLVPRQLAGGLEGAAQLHALPAEHAPRGLEAVVRAAVADRLVAGIATGRGVRVAPLRAAGSLPPASSHVVEDDDLAEAVRLLARSQQIAIGERARHLLRLRSALREFFPAALQAFPALHVPVALTLLELAPDPGAAATLTEHQVTQALGGTRGRDVPAKARRLLQVLHTPRPRQPPLVEQAYATLVQSQVRVIVVLNVTITEGWSSLSCKDRR